MSVYLDASLIVALLAPEPASAAAHDWLEHRRGARLRGSAWVGLEVASGLTRKLRTRDLTMAECKEALAAYRRLASAFVPVAIEPGDFARAERFVAEADLALRAGDALHLAIAAGHGLSVATLDIRMAEGGRALGIDTELVWIQEQGYGE